MAASGSALSPEAIKAAELVRDHPRDQVLPETLARKFGIERWEAVTLLKELADAGFGSFILGRRGGKTRLERAAILPDLDGLTTEMASGTAPSSDTFQVFLLRRNPPVQIKVPIDLTRDEAEKLGKWLLLVANESE